MLTSDNVHIGSPCVTASKFAYNLEFNKLNGPMLTLTIKGAINIIILPVLTVWRWLAGPISLQKALNRLIDCFCAVVYLICSTRK